MKTVIVAVWAIVASASTDSVSNKHDIGISSGYGGAYGYVPTPRVIKLDRVLPLSVAISNVYDGAYGYVSHSEVINADRKAQSNGTVLSSNDETYDYASTPRVNVNRNLMPDIAVSSGYGGAYGYFPTSSVKVNNVINVQRTMEIPEKINMRKVVSMPQEAKSFSPGYSGYGHGLNSYSGYSRYPIYTGYGFAYASNWLGTI